MIVTPLISVNYERVENIEASDSSKESITQQNSVRVMSSDNGFIKEVELKEYLIGCVAGEMPATYHAEALKAQAVASYTYMKYVSLRDNELLGGADISDDSSVHQSYLNIEGRTEKWKDNFDKYEEIVSDAVSEVLYSYLTYNNEPAMCVYHHLNSGMTKSAESVWGERYEYLVEVTSNGDKLSPQFNSEKKITVEDYKKILTENGASDNGILVGENKSKDENEIILLDKTFSKEDVRDMFSLKSADFDIKVKEDNIIFTCRGHGHFVGMSQYGADYMARQGSTYDEILAHYYPGTKLMILKK